MSEHICFLGKLTEMMEAIVNPMLPIRMFSNAENSLFCNMVAISHMLLLGTWNVDSANEKLKFLKI